MLRALRDTGYDGWLSAEILPGGDPDAMAQAAAAYMRELLAAYGLDGAGVAQSVEAFLRKP